MVEGGQVVSAAFIGVGKQTFNISDLKVTGWEEDTAFEYGDFQCNIFILTPGGATEVGKNKNFVYQASWSDELNDWMGGHLPGVWYDYAGAVIEPGADNDFKLTPSQGLWFFTPVGDGEHPTTLTFDSIFPQPQE